MPRFFNDMVRALLKHGRIFWLIGGVVLAFALQGLLGLVGTPASSPTASGPGGGDAPMGLPVEVATATQTDLDDTVNVAGSLRADKGITLRPEVAGVVRELPFTEGSKVSASTVLVKLDDAITRASVAQARAEVRLAQRSLDRLKALQEQDEALVSKRDFDTATSNLEVAQAALQTAQAQLDKTHISAPFAGTVGLQKVSIGQYVSPGDELVTLQSLDPLKVEFSLPENYGPQIEAGMPIDVRIDALNGRIISATVTAVDPAVTTGGRSVNVTAQIPNPEGDLRPGMFARVATTFGQAANAVQIPEEAIVPEGTAKFVYRVVNGKAAKTAVEIGIRARGLVQITQGLNPGDLVVTAGLMKIKDGAPLTPMNLSVQAGPQGTTPPAGEVMPAAGQVSESAPSAQR